MFPKLLLFLHYTTEDLLSGSCEATQFYDDGDLSIDYFRGEANL